jgi:cytochrome c oxidase assembly protein subunit 11
MNAVQPKSRPDRKNQRTLIVCVGVVCGMVGLSFASVPLYQLFCAVTGYGGTTQVSAEKSATITDRDMRVRFDATTMPGLPWNFQPVQREVRLKVGENAVAYYRAKNTSDETFTGVATFNVTPQKVGQYFQKIECFCFSEQTLKPGESADMPVAFFVDPSISDDPNMNDVKTITLSYSFFSAPSNEPKVSSAEKLGAVETPQKIVADQPVGNSRRIN